MTVLTSRDGRSEYLTVAEAALLLNCSAPTVRRRIADGSLRAVKLGVGRNCAVRIPRSALDEWLARAETGGEAA